MLLGHHSSFRADLGALRRAWIDSREICRRPKFGSKEDSFDAEMDRTNPRSVQ